MSGDGGWGRERGGGLQSDGDVRVVGLVLEGWMTGWILRHNYLHKIPSPFPFWEGQREQGKEKKKKTESEVCRKGLMFLLGLAYEELYTWWSTGLMGEETHRKTHPCLHARTHTRLLKMLFVVKQMLKRSRDSELAKKGKKITVTTKLQRLLISQKIQLNKLFKLSNRWWNTHDSQSVIFFFFSCFTKQLHSGRNFITERREVQKISNFSNNFWTTLKAKWPLSPPCWEAIHLCPLFWCKLAFFYKLNFLDHF